MVGKCPVVSFFESLPVGIRLSPGQVNIDGGLLLSSVVRWVDRDQFVVQEGLYVLEPQFIHGAREQVAKGVVAVFVAQF